MTRSGSTLHQMANFSLRFSSIAPFDLAMMKSGCTPYEFNSLTALCVGFVFISPKVPGTGRYETMTKMTSPGCFRRRTRAASMKSAFWKSPTVPPISITDTWLSLCAAADSIRRRISSRTCGMASMHLPPYLSARSFSSTVLYTMPEVI